MTIFLLGAPLGAAAESKNAPAPRKKEWLVFKADFPKPLEMRVYDTAQIKRLLLKRDTPESVHVPGLTEAEYALEWRFSVGWKKSNEEKYWMWVEELAVDFSYKKVHVFVSTNYAPPQCAYHAILDHEREHVSVHRETHAEYAEKLRRALLESEDLPREANPLAFYSVKGGQKVLKERIAHHIAVVRRAFEEALKKRQQEVDAPAAYRAVQEKCSDW